MGEGKKRGAQARCEEVPGCVEVVAGLLPVAGGGGMLGVPLPVAGGAVGFTGLLLATGVAGGGVLPREPSTVP